MKSTIIAAVAALAASASAQVGSAVVVNACNYDVYLFDVPAADGGYDEIDKVLSSGDTFTQQWTELSNGDGWSIKLSTSTSLTNIMQYEYTWEGSGTIWYDLSDVNGNPWNGNWEITSNTDTCTPKQQAYRYSTDDAYGEQACPGDATITVTLCSGDADASSLASSAAASTTTTTAASSTATEATTTTSESSSAVTTEATTEATTLVTTTSAAGGAVSTVVETQTYVAYTTQYQHHGPPGKRDVHAHRARHPHGHHA